MVRRNLAGGFTCPPGKMQVVGWLAFALQLATYYGLLAAYWHPKVVLPCYTVLVTSALVSGFMCTVKDPSDQCSKPGLEHMVKCQLCKRQVRLSSKHCSLCGRCIAGFDHHCDWLNICIGSANYRYFLVLLISLEALTSVQVVCGAVGLTYLGKETERDWKWGLMVAGVVVIELCLAVLVVILGFLLCFHAFLRAKSMTTYEYSLCRRRRTAQVTPLKYETSLKNLDKNRNSTFDSTSIGSKATSRIDGNTLDLSESPLPAFH